MAESVERELEILENIYHTGSRVRQRDLARVVGLSLGMTNAILKRLAHKGWLVIRKVNNRNIRYAVTPAGVEAITRRSYRYFRRTIKNVVDYKGAIETLVSRIRDRGFHTLALVGSSDLDFVLEHVCGKEGVRFERRERVDGAGGVFYVYSERRRRSAVSAPAAARSGQAGGGEGGMPAAVRPEAAAAYLRDILL